MPFAGHQESVPQLKSDYAEAVNALGTQLDEETVNRVGFQPTSISMLPSDYNCDLMLFPGFMQQK